MKNIFFAFLLLISLQVYSQTPIGTFTAHPAVHSFHSVAADGNTVYASSSNALFLLEKSSLSNENASEINVWTKIDGLSDVDIVKVHSFSHGSIQMVAYENGNLDFIKGDKLVNISDVKDKSVAASKSLKRCFAHENTAMLVYPFGIVIIDLDEMVVRDTWFTKRDNKQCLPTDITHDGERWYISTDEGIFSSDIQSPVLSDFSRWTMETPVYVKYMATVDNTVYAVKSPFEPSSDIYDTIYMRGSNGWNPTGLNYRSVRNMKHYGDTLLVCNWDFVELFDSRLQRIFQCSWYGQNGYPDARDAIVDGNDVWVADNAYGLVQNNMVFYYTKYYVEPSLHSDFVERMCAQDGIVAAVHGSRKGSSAFAPAYNFPALSWRQNGEWQYNSLDFLNYDPIHQTYDLTDVAINPNDETEWYVASWGNGLFKLKDKRVVAHYNARNSILDSTSYGQTFVSGLQFDKKGNLWMTNSQSPNMLVVLTNDGQWYSYNIGSGVITSTPEGVVAENLVIDSHGIKWVNFPRDATLNRYSLVAYSDNGTINNKSDDKLARIDMNVAAEVSSSRVFCMTEDLDGELWIGTDKGVKVIYYPEKVFNGNAYPRNILLEQDGYVSVLLEYEEVTSIAVDGANRKWIGTSKAGVFLMSENGQEELLHFTSADHPLFSDQIVSICIDHFTGDVYFATAKGLVSYRGTATEGFEEYEDLLVYPNPVPHNYSGYVAVSGLKANSHCKITDSSGRLVWQGFSDGGQLVWDCKDHFGKRPATGVYYVMVSDINGKEKIVTKFVFVN